MTAPDPTLQEHTATYVFAVCAHIDHHALATLPGLGENSPVRPLSLGALTAVVQHVEAARFSEDAWRERLSDQGELERCARAHHHVVSAVAARGATVPLPLATLYRSDERARRGLRQDAERFHTVLRRIEGRVEWGVKVYAAPPPRPAAAQTPAPSPSPSPSSSSPSSSSSSAGAGRGRPSSGDGRAYLDRKRGIQKRREQHHDEALRAAETVDTAMRTVAAASRHLRTHVQEPLEPRRTQVLNAAYLVDEKRYDDVARTVRALRRSTGMDIEMSGPWVPYSFVGEV
ncbi:GvpL/GvpF family gas vesicle protein [Streptomyces sp. NPDC088182]|uniref:GvpL/GvpF family gas vesicle protein n=1 Tax=Streptomyces sp. NPDC088182 TaxID=3365838 RepID=UPI0037F91D19